MFVWRYTRPKSDGFRKSAAAPDMERLYGGGWLFTGRTPETRRIVVAMRILLLLAPVSTKFVIILVGVVMIGCGA